MHWWGPPQWDAGCLLFPGPVFMLKPKSKVQTLNHEITLSRNHSLWAAHSTDFHYNQPKGKVTKIYSISLCSFALSPTSLFPLVPSWYTRSLENALFALSTRVQLPGPLGGKPCQRSVLRVCPTEEMQEDHIGECAGPWGGCLRLSLGCWPSLCVCLRVLTCEAGGLNMIWHDWYLCASLHSWCCFCAWKYRLSNDTNH